MRVLGKLGWILGFGDTLFAVAHALVLLALRPRLVKSVAFVSEIPFCNRSFTVFDTVGSVQLLSMSRSYRTFLC